MMPAETKLSIIVPAYNEADRIGSFLENLLNFSNINLKDYEIIIVNDGSTDDTEDVIKKLIKSRKYARLIGYSRNKGKGEAVKFGIFNSNGEKIIFIDADGSINPNLMTDMLKKLDEHEVVVGDRSLEESKVKTKVHRWFLGKVFNFMVILLFQTNIKDNLCGFKGFKRDVAKELFYDLTEKRWLFDVEIFYKIKRHKIRLCCMPIRWEYVGKSKVTFFDPFKMLLRLFVLRIKLLRNRFKSSYIHLFRNLFKRIDL